MLSHTIAMRRTSFFLLATALLTVLLLPRAVHARIPIEQAQREFQGRYYFGTGGYVTWPPCACRTPAPAFPADKFYGDLDNNPSLAVQLVRNLARMGSPRTSCW